MKHYRFPCPYRLLCLLLNLATFQKSELTAVNLYNWLNQYLFLMPGSTDIFLEIGRQEHFMILDLGPNDKLKKVNNSLA